MKRQWKIHALRAAVSLTLSLVLCLATAMPARASFIDWLLGPGEQARTQAPVGTTATPAPTGVPPTPGIDAPTLEPDLPLKDGLPLEPTGTPEPTAIPAADTGDDGMLRVYLKSLGDPSRLGLTFAGAYAVDSALAMRFDRDTKIDLVAAGGRVYLVAGGLTADLGRTVTFTRHAAGEDEENGLYIAQSEKPNLFCGDLTVTARGGSLVPVLRIDVEDYLYGVVAYEMSDSFPIEALKAQTVAARTYALRSKSIAGDRDYDLTDTTADQVFKGFDDRYGNVLSAVDATRGVVGIANGAFASCYYTASNGGQTALASQAWGEDAAGADAWLAVTDDPYDLENPRSLQNEVTITPLCQGSDALLGMLLEALKTPLTLMGYTEDEWRLDSIAAITPSNPKAEGSRWYKGLDFDLNVSVQVAMVTPVPTATPTADPSASPEAVLSASPTVEPAATAAEPRRMWLKLNRPLTVTLDVYDQIKDGLKLGLNKADYELVSVETEANAAGEPTRFRIIMRRFGHGVGMSQRGAQWMAGHYGKDYGEILSFYYPGMEIRRAAWPERALTPLPELPMAAASPTPTPVPTPTPAPLPAPEAGERLAHVELESRDSQLNVRETANINARVVATMAAGRQVLVSGEPDEDGWVAIRTAEFSGFVKAEYLEED